MDKQLPLRILHVVPNMNAGGLETLIMNIYRNIDRSQVQFDFLLHYEGEFFYSKEIRELGGRIYNLSVRDDNNVIKYLRDLRRFFAEHKEYTVVHGHMVSTAVFYLYYAKKNDIPMRIIHSHNTDTNSGMKGRLKKFLALFSTMFANTYFACGEMAGKSLFRGKKFIIINNGIDIEKFKFDKDIRIKVREELGLQDKNIYGHVGRFNYQKNHDFLIDIFSEIFKIDNHAVLLLIGDGELKKSILEKINKMGLSDKIIYLGVRADVNRLYQAMDCFILPSYFEGFPVVATECQAAALPMLVSDNVSKEIKIIDKIEFLGLQEASSKWAVKATEMVRLPRIDESDKVKLRGFDIKEEAKKITRIYQRKNKKD